MDYWITFLEGIVTFLSPCLLPMIPIYVSFFGGQEPTGNKRRAAANALGFILGFSAVFSLMGVFAGSLGRALRQYSAAVNLIGGIVVILFGLNFMGLLNLRFLNRSRQAAYRLKETGFWGCALFGVVFALGWTPCVGAFLGSALMLAAAQGSALRGVLMLLTYSAGLGVPFFMSAVLIGRLKNSFGFIKRHYRTVNLICGGFLVVTGFLMAAGLLGRLISL